jgi:hypothetical protein
MYRGPSDERSEATKSKELTSNDAAKRTPARAVRAAASSRRCFERATVRCPVNGASAWLRSGTRSRVARRTAWAPSSRPATGIWSTRSPLNHAVPGPTSHRSGPVMLSAASPSASTSAGTRSSSTSPRNRSVMCHRPGRTGLTPGTVPSSNEDRRFSVASSGQTATNVRTSSPPSESRTPGT